MKWIVRICKLNLQVTKKTEIYFVILNKSFIFAKILKKSFTMNRAHTDNPKFFSGYMSEVEALFSILREYNLII